MHLGVLHFCTDETISPAELARAAEERGFESLFLPEHTHIPVERASVWPGGDELPRHYHRLLDPFVALGAAAAVTDRLRLGTGICLIVQRDPITLAKEVATLDQLSRGRVLLGIGAGWNREEMINHGTDPATRFALMRERVLAMKQIWTSDEATFHGDHVSFDAICQWPKPVHRPHPPILLGGDGPRVLDRVLDYAEGWFPSLRDTDLEPRLADLRRRAAARGVDPPPVTVFRAPPERGALERFAAAGVERCVLRLPQGARDEALRALDQYAELTSSLDAPAREPKPARSDVAR